MKSPTNPTCRKCGKTKGGLCFRVNGSRLEDFLGHTLHRCDKCGQLFKVAHGEVYEVFEENMLAQVH